jgi:hypothetical protein
VCLACLAGLVLCHRLYLSRSTYPLSPVLDALPGLSVPLAHIVLGALLVALAGGAVTPWPRPCVAAALALALVLAAGDQSRWQPWFYQYLLMLGAFVGVARRQATEDGLDTCRLVLVGLYLWSGLQKLNVTFATVVFPWLVAPLTGRLPAALGAWLGAAGPVVPVVEIALALALLVPGARHAAVLLAVALHASVLLLLGPPGHAINAVIWPWNVAMPVLVVLLFWRAPVRARQVLGRRRPAWHVVVAVLVLVLPLLSTVGLWDAYLSGALYSGNIQEAVIVVTPDVKARLPEEARRHVVTNRTGAELLVVGDWSLAAVGAPPYPEARVYRALARWVCGHAVAPDDVALVVFGKPAPWTGARATTREACGALTAR